MTSLLSKDKFRNYLSIWGRLSRNQKIAIISLLFLLLAFPALVIAVFSPVIFFPRAGFLITTPVTPPITPPYTPTPIPRTPPPYVTPTPYPPTPIVTFRPTPTPIVHPTPTPIVVTPTPTPIPTVSNSNPRIVTNSLNRGYVGATYSSRVFGLDMDRNDNLVMYIMNLPAGLRQGTCSRYRSLFGVNNIYCQIEGLPQRAGYYRVDVALFDGRGGYTYKSLILSIFNRRSLFSVR